MLVVVVVVMVMVSMVEVAVTAVEGRLDDRSSTAGSRESTETTLKARPERPGCCAVHRSYGREIGPEWMER